METFFDIIILSVISLSLSMNIAMFKKINQIDSRFEPIYRKNEEIIEHVYGDFEGIEKAIIILSERINCLPDTIKDDNHRSLLALRDALESAKPIKPNNWDSFREAFKGPARVEINERN